MSTMTEPRQRMPSPAKLIPEAVQPIQDLIAATRLGGVPPATLGLVHLRASQINGCGFCVDYGSRHARQEGETDQRLMSVAAWREATCFTDAERAALALAEAATRLSDRSDPVPDEIWEQAAEHYDECALAALVLMIALTNLFNTVNVTTRQIAGSMG